MCLALCLGLRDEVVMLGCLADISFYSVEATESELKDAERTVQALTSNKKRDLLHRPGHVANRCAYGDCSQHVV